MKERAKNKKNKVNKYNVNTKNKNIKTKNVKSKVKPNFKNEAHSKVKRIDKKTFAIRYKNKIIMSVLIIIVLILLIFAFYKILYMHRNNNIFAQNAEKIQNDLDNPIFKIERILMYSDANVEDLSENQNLSNINISQFTDFAIYINNIETITELTEENTVNNLYIDNITVTGTDFGSQKVFYKDINDICKYRKIDTGTNRIDFKVLHNNEEKESNEDENVFYTDCSEPIVLSYVNENIVKNEDLSTSNEKMSLDGSILRNLGIDLEDLNYKISFTINIENNLGEIYKCNCSLNVNLDSSDGGIYTGYIMQIYNFSENNFKFIKL